MKKIKLSDLRPGMTTATPVYSKKGQILVPAHTILTTQNISRLSYYEIDSAFIFSQEEMNSRLIDNTRETTPHLTTYNERIINTKEFQVFQTSYHHKVSFITDSLNGIIKNSKKIDQIDLLTEVNHLFQEKATSLSVFDMLHNMREIDDSTYAHSVNVGIIARMLGYWLGFSTEDLDLLTLSGLFHDIGKCMIDPAIIQKPGKLTSAEYEQVKQHPLLGYEILKNQSLHPHILYSALMHHERSDGSGYPAGLKSDATDSFAQIISIADVYDAMTSNRCYRDGLCPFEVIATFEQEGLHKYNPKFILTFLEHIADVYNNNDVMLNDSSQGTIVLINRNQLSRPIIRLTDGTFINLLERRDLYIDKII